METCLKRAVASTVCVLGLACLTMGQVWPKLQGVYIAKSSAAIPAFPKVLPEYKFAGKDKDYWGESYGADGNIRVFEGNEWLDLTDFPHTMNGCSAGMWMLRWRASSPEAKISIGIANNLYDQGVSTWKTGSYGYMYGDNCEQPYFRIGKSSKKGESTLADVYYELRFWKAAP